MHRFLSIGIVTIAALFTLDNTAFGVGPCCCFCSEGRCQVKVEREEVETKKFTCECETVCIPPVRFPWESGPSKKCGKVRKIKKLGTTKGKETVCTYEWSAVQCCPSCARKIRGRRGCAHEGSSHCDVSERNSTCRTGVMIVPPAVALEPTGLEPIGTAQFEAAQSEAEAEAFAARYPKVTVATLDAIRTGKPDADGWIILRSPQPQSLTAETELIETSVQ